MRWSRVLRSLSLLALLLAPVPVAAIDFTGTGLTVQAEFPVGGDNFGFGFDALWVMNGPKLLRLDPRDNSVSSHWIDGASGQVRGIVAGDNALWIPDVGSQKIYKFDPRTNAVRLKIYADMYGQYGSIAVGFGSVWVVTVNDRLLERFSTETGKRQAGIKLPSDGAGVVVANGAIWVSGNLKGELYRIDPQTNTIADVIRVHALPRMMVSAFDSVWVVSEGDTAVQRVDAGSGKVVASIDLAQQPSSCCGEIAAGAGYIWATMPGIALAQIDPNTNTTVRVVRAPFHTSGLRYGAGSLWFAGSFVRRVAPPVPTQ